jgi:hypothetical protein
MSLHRFRVDDADWHPHPISLAVYIAGVAVLAWGVHAFAQMPEGQGGASPRAEPWRAAESKWSRAPKTDQQRVARSVTAP